MLNSKNHLLQVSVKEVSESMTCSTNFLYISLCPENYASLYFIVEEASPLVSLRRRETLDLEVHTFPFIVIKTESAHLALWKQ